MYFASQVLERQVHLLEHLDRATLVVLVENPRLETFCPQVKSKLISFLSSKKLRHNSSGINNKQQSSVRFQVEIDGRDTFPNSQTSQDFKKQWDMFHNLLRNWKTTNGDFSDSHVSSSKNVDFSTEVVKLLTLQENPINMQHFAR